MSVAILRIVEWGKEEICNVGADSEERRHVEIRARFDEFVKCVSAHRRWNGFL